MRQALLLSALERHRRRVCALPRGPWEEPRPVLAATSTTDVGRQACPPISTRRAAHHHLARVTIAPPAAAIATPTQPVIKSTAPSQRTIVSVSDKVFEST